MIYSFLKHATAIGAALALSAAVFGVSDDEIAKMRAAIPETPVVAPSQPRAMLVFNLSEGFKHSSIPYWAKVLDIMAEKTGAFTVIHSEDMAVFSPETLKQFDAICFNNTTHLEFDNDQKWALMDFVKAGKGIVGIHAATDNFYDWPEATYMMGGTFQGHPWGSGGTWAVKLDDPEHPLLTPFGGEGFKVNDEIYRTNPPYYSRDRQRVLLSLDMTDPATRTAEGVTPEDMDTGISWIKPFGKGRVFYCSLGHNHHLTWTTPILEHFLAGIQYALGDLKVDDTPLGEPSPAMDEAAVKALVDVIKDYDWDKSRAALTALERIIRDQAGEPEHLFVLEELMQPLLAAENNRAAREFACRQLSVFGTSVSVPAMAVLLDSPDTEHIARYALERIPDSSADIALLEALKASREVALKIGLMTSLGARRYDGAVDTIGRIAATADPKSAHVALRVLGAIGSPKAATALIDLQKTLDTDRQFEVLDALAECANSLARDGKTNEAIKLYGMLYDADNPSLIRVAALIGIAQTDSVRLGRLLPAAVTSRDTLLQTRAIRLIAQVQDPAALESVISAAEGLSVTARVKLLAALADNGSAIGRKAAVEAVADQTTAVRIAAYQALSAVGNADSVMLLAKAAAKATDRSEKDAARQALYRLAGPDIDAVIVQGIAQTTGPSRDEQAAMELIRAVSERQIEAANTLLFAAAREESARVAQQALWALQTTVTADDMPAMAALLADKPAAATENVALGAAEKITDRNQRAAALLTRFEKLDSTAAKVSFLRVMGRLGDANAIPVIRRMRNSDDKTLSNAAFRAMADWPGMDFFNEMRQLATAEEADQTQRILAFRAYLRLLVSDEEKTEVEVVDALAAAMRMTDRPQDQRLVLSAMSDYGTAKSLQLAQAQLSKPELKAEAEVAVVAICQRLAATEPGTVIPALTAVRDQTSNTTLKEQAQSLLASAENRVGYITDWAIAGPYTEAGKSAEALFDTVFAPEKDGEEVQWRSMPVCDDASQPWLMDLDRAIGGNDRVAYAKTVLVAPDAMDAVLEIGSDDGVKVWLNGELVHANHAIRPVTPGEDKAQVQLKKGDNSVLMKITQAGGGWGFCLRVTHPDGTPVLELNTKK